MIFSSLNRFIGGGFKPKSSDKAIRSIAKSLSWRVLGTMDTVLISRLITGTWFMAVSIGSVELITKMILYFLHERGWDRIAWGRPESKEE